MQCYRRYLVGEDLCLAGHPSSEYWRTHFEGGLWVYGCREAMQQEKHMLEAHLLQTAGEVAVAERELTSSQLSSLASARSSCMSYSSDSDDSDATASIGGVSPPRSQISRLAEMSAREVESLRAENDAIMKVRHRYLSVHPDSARFDLLQRGALNESAGKSRWTSEREGCCKEKQRNLLFPKAADKCHTPQRQGGYFSFTACMCTYRNSWKRRLSWRNCTKS